MNRCGGREPPAAASTSGRRQERGTFAMPRSQHCRHRSRRCAPLCGILLASLLAFLPGLASFAPAHAEEIDWKAGRLGHLAPTIGTYRYDAVPGDPAVKAALETLFGTDLAAAIPRPAQRRVGQGCGSPWRPR